MMSRKGKTDPNDDVLVTEKELAARWRMAGASLANQRSTGRGPSYLTIGRTVRYRMSDIIAYERHSGER